LLYYTVSDIKKCVYDVVSCAVTQNDVYDDDSSGVATLFKSCRTTRNIKKYDIFDKYLSAVATLYKSCRIPRNTKNWSYCLVIAYKFVGYHRPLALKFNMIRTLRLDSVKIDLCARTHETSQYCVLVVE